MIYPEYGKVSSLACSSVSRVVQGGGQKEKVMTVKRDSNISFIDTKNEEPELCSTVEREEKNCCSINRVHGRSWKYLEALLSCGQASRRGYFWENKGCFRHDRTSAADCAGIQRRYALKVPDCQEVWVNQLEVLDFQRQSATNGKSACFRGNRRSRRDYDLYGRSDCMTGNISFGMMCDSIEKGPGGVISRQIKYRVKPASAALHVGLRSDNNGRVSREGQTGYRFSPDVELSKRNVVSLAEGCNMMPLARRFNSSLLEKDRRRISSVDDVSEKGVFYLADYKNNTSKSRNVKNADLYLGGCESKEVIIRGDFCRRKIEGNDIIKQVINVKPIQLRISLKIVLIGR